MSGTKHFNEITACQGCGQIVSIPDMPDNTTAKCARCHTRLLKKGRDTIDRTLALAMTSLILFAIANSYPFLGMRIEGFVQQTNLVTGIIALYHQEMPALATIVLLTILVLPLFQILGLIYLLVPMRFGTAPWKAAAIFKLVRHSQPWGMMEVYMLGILISMVKLAKMAVILPGLASAAFMILIWILAATLSGLNPNDVWKRIPIKIKESGRQSKKDIILTGCTECGLLCKTDVTTSHAICPRCQSTLHYRKANSMNRTWALVVAAAILYLPANIYPITVTRALGYEQADTIISGVIYFFSSGSWHIALIIFAASVIIPLIKLIVLVYLLISVKKKSLWKPKDRTRLYRITEAMGRWSMVDVFVVTILVALVQLGPMAAIEAGPGAAYFCAVVIITMFAAESFDSRLIWDAMEEPDET